MDDLIAFLRARLDDDEQTARAADPALSYMLGAIEYAYDKVEADQRHALRHSPARVLAEVDAKRRLIELHQESVESGYATDFCKECDFGGVSQTYYPCATLRLLALPYAAHPDYRDEWRP